MRLSDIWYSWPIYYNGSTTNNTYVNRITNAENIYLHGETYRCRLGPGLEDGYWYGPIATFYDASVYDSRYLSLETLLSHYNNSSDCCDNGFKMRGGRIVECSSGYDRRNYGLYNPYRLCIAEKVSVDTSGWIQTCTVSTANNNPIGLIGYVLMQPLARSDQNVIDPRMMQATTSNIFRPSALIEQNPYAPARYFTMDLLFVDNLDASFQNNYQTINAMCDSLINNHPVAGLNFGYYIGMGAKYSTSMYSNATYVRSNVYSPESGNYGNDIDSGSGNYPIGRTSNQTQNDPSINLIVRGRCATYYNSMAQHYLIGFIRTAKQISNVSKLYPILSRYTTGWSDLPKSAINNIKYAGTTSNTSYLTALGNLLPSGYEPKLQYLYTFYLDTKNTSVINTLLKGGNGYGRGIIMRGCKYQ